MVNLDLSKHCCIVGETQSGKTYFANFLFKSVGGIYFDIEDLKDIDEEVRITKASAIGTFRTALGQHKSIHYVPSNELETQKQEIRWLWDQLVKFNQNIYVFVDELQNYGSDRRNLFDVFAVRGLKHGIHLISISQRPSNISKTIATQSTSFVFFDLSDFERPYFLKYKLPFDEIKLKLTGAKKYSFVIYNRGRPLENATRLK